jgi:hypothetical protein
VEGAVMTHDEFDKAVDSLSDKFFAAIESQVAIQFPVVAAAAFCMLEAIVNSAPDDDRHLVKTCVRQSLEELLRQFSSQHPSDPIVLN